jgi:type I restriction enzyme, S subunit
LDVKLKPYPVYKDSGVPWLGEVPAHWQVRRLKSHMSSIIEQTDRRDSDELYVALEHVESWTGRLREAESEISFDSQVKRFRAGDVLFGKLRPYLAKVTRPNRNGVCVGEFLVLRPINGNLSPGYLEQLIRSKPIIDAINASTFGAKMPRADWQFIGGMSVPCPSLSEQAAIVHFLDYMDRRIRRYIRAKQKLIKLLEEQKQAIIHQAVTRGLDSNVRLKPSGIEWLDAIPEHWSEIRLKFLARKITDGEHISPLLADKGIPLLSAKDIRDRTILYDVDKFVPLDHAEQFWRRCQPERGDLLVVSRGATIGRVALVENDIPFCLMGSVILCKRKENYTAEFLYYALNAHHAQTSLWFTSASSAQQAIYIQDVAELRLPIPPLSERGTIVRHLEYSLGDIRDAVDRTQREIQLLREYRTRLIADVVTGKLDVREMAARLPDEAEEPEPLDETEALSDTDAEAADDLIAASEEDEP